MEATRSKYGYCTKVRLHGTETEIITQFVLELLCTELLRADQVILILILMIFILTYFYCLTSVNTIYTSTPSRWPATPHSPLP